MGRIPLIVLVVALGCGACASGQLPAVRTAATDFQDAVRRADGGRACELLADEARGNLESAARQPCEAALPALDLPAGAVRSVEVWGEDAQVRLDAGVLFLARFQAGWKVTGAGCEPRADQPYDCDVEA